jgi:acyl-CoA thioesterase-1
MSRRLLVTTLALVALSACSFRNVSCGTAPPAPIEPVSLSGGETPVDPEVPPLLGIAFLGDSLTAGLGVMSDDAFPTKIVEMFFSEGYTEVDILNGGLSGDTTAGGLRRVDGVLQPGVHILVVALGGNDALRGLSTTQTHDNLAAIIETALGRGVMVLLAGMQAPTNLGTDYQESFRAVYQQLSAEYAGSVEFVPFLLEGVAANSRLNQPDGIHPNQAGHLVIAELLYPRLRDMVDKLIFSGN